MRGPAAIALALLVAFLVSGCMGGTDRTSGATSTTAAPARCPPGANGTIPGWTAHGGDWVALASAAGHAEVVCGAATEALSSLVQDDEEYSDLEAEVSFNMQAGDSGAGLVIHFKDDRNYSIVRYSPREQGWHIFTVVEGNRQKQNAGSVTPPTTNPELDQWVALRVESRGGHIQAWDGPTLVIDHRLQPEASRGGRVGYFLRDSGMVALFDDFEARPLDVDMG